MNIINFSFIIPVYNRPNEVEELLSSFVQLTSEIPFEIVIVEDGSQYPSKEVVDDFSDVLNISYYSKKNTGPGDSRNFGMSKAKGNYFIILDSDVILPNDYLSAVNRELEKNYVDCYGGPDDAHYSFNSLQKAINFVMTSFITTGGIRGGKKQIDNYQPRSFNMGISKKAFELSGGFGDIHPGEDPDLSLRLKDLGFELRYFGNAKVFHKRRISWNKFYKQVNKFGLVRPILNDWHPNSGSIVFWFPSLFSTGLLLSTFLFFIGFKFPSLFFLSYYIAVFLVALINTKDIIVSLFALIAMTIQFFGYGFAFLKSNIMLNILNKNPREHFPNLFFDSNK